MDTDFEILTSLDESRAVLKLLPSDRAIILQGLPRALLPKLEKELVLDICQNLLKDDHFAQSRYGDPAESHPDAGAYVFVFPVDLPGTVPNILIEDLIRCLITVSAGGTIASRELDSDSKDHVRQSKTEDKQSTGEQDAEAPAFPDIFRIQCRSLLESADALNLSEHSLLPPTPCDIYEIATGLRRLADTMSSETEFVSVQEAAELLNRTPGAVRVQCQKDALHARKVGRDWVISREEVERFRQRQG